MWTAEFRGLVMGAPDSPVSIVQVDGLLSLPDVRSSDLALLQRQGTHAGEDYLTGRTITLTLEVYGVTSDEFSTALAQVQNVFAVRQGGFSWAEDPIRFRFPGAFGGMTAYANVRVRRRATPLDLTFAYGVATVVVELYSTSPVISADDVETVAVTSVKPGSPAGTPAPEAFILQRGSMAPAMTATIENAHTPQLVGRTDKGDWSIKIATVGNCSLDFAAQRAYYENGLPVPFNQIQVVGGWPVWLPGDWPISIKQLDPARWATARYTWRPTWI